MMWPSVQDELVTLDLVLEGRSLSRFGDGEINLCFGRSCITQKPDNAIRSSLRNVILNPGKCLVGIPHMRGPKAKFWQQYQTQEVLNLFGNRPYYSAFVTRPDSAPWIDRDEYWSKLRRLWAGKRVTLIRGSGKSLTKDMLPEAKRVYEIVAPMRDAFADYNRLLNAIGAYDVVLLCLGPTATVMAHDLCARDFHAVDLGHVGMFLRKHDRGEPMTITEAEKAHDRRL